MAFRTLTIDSPAEVHVRSGQLTVQRVSDSKPLQIDLDDLACIVLANLDITLSTGALNVISEHGITILGVGRNFIPTSIMLPFAKHSRYSEVVDRQLSMSVPFQKQLWKHIVRQKIENQASVLEIDLSNEEAANLSRSCRREMTSVLRNACMVGGRKVACLQAVEEMVVSFKQALGDHDTRRLQLPRVLPVEKVG